MKSALPTSIFCGGLQPNGATCPAMRPSFGPGLDDDTVQNLRRAGWRVVSGKWSCPEHVPAGWSDPPDAVAPTPNPHCTVCGDTRGGAYGHEAYECTWTTA